MGRVINIFLFIALGWGMAFGAPGLVAAPSAPSIALKSAALESFSAPPPPGGPETKPSLKDTSFPLKEAVNLKEVLELVGPLSPEQRAFLEKNRFLLLPKSKMMLFKSPSGGGPHDEMLANFDGLGGSLDESLREPWNARFIGPDVFLHAFYKYCSIRLAALETGPLREKVRFLLEGLFLNAKALKAASGSGAKNWERLMAQMLVPLILLDNGSGQGQPGTAKYLPPDSPEGALALFEGYSASFSPSTAKDIRAELRRIYQADSRQNCLLGLSPVANPEGPLDYALFRPRGHYANDPRLRAYYRAMTWLGSLGWSGASEEGLAGALNWALAMSFERPEREAGKKKAAAGEGDEEPPAEKGPDLPAVWAEVMALNSFFLGYPQSPSYTEWLPFLMKEAGVPEFTADTAAEAQVLARLRSGASALKPRLPYFPALKAPTRPGVISVFPGRFGLPGVILNELTHQPGLRDDAPRAFSAFWLPAALGHGYALENLPRQLTLSYRSEAAAASEELTRRRQEAFRLKLDGLAAGLGSTAEADWFSSLGTAWLGLYRSLKADYGSGYPLYMRGPAFPAKRIQTILGSFTELSHETLIEGSPAPAALEAGPAAALVEEGGEAAPLVKGFVEPNPLFWREMGRLVAYMMAGFEKHGLFPDDLAEFGALWRFSRRLERCAALSEKELRGEELSRDDYEFIRLFTLDWMAAPLENQPTPVEQRRSALVSPIQTMLPEHVGGRETILYEATGEPSLCLVLVGNEKSPRLSIGLSYSHYEFVVPQGVTLNNEIWRKAVYGLSSAADPGSLPPASFWYDPLNSLKAK